MEFLTNKRYLSVLGFLVNEIEHNLEEPEASEIFETVRDILSGFHDESLEKRYQDIVKQLELTLNLKFIEKADLQ